MTQIKGQDIRHKLVNLVLLKAVVSEDLTTLRFNLILVERLQVGNGFFLFSFSLRVVLVGILWIISKLIPVPETMKAGNLLISFE
jgi:hypothetical protein